MSEHVRRERVEWIQQTILLEEFRENDKWGVGWGRGGKEKKKKKKKKTAAAGEQVHSSRSIDSALHLSQG